jgi:hypothetical protein
MARRTFAHLAQAVADGHAAGRLEGGERAVTLLSCSCSTATRRSPRTRRPCKRSPSSSAGSC